ncbi:MAG: hypothetical protein M3546_11165 [Actinomycetota bacterium]|nr:hypothetical protein [Actinomycetota bacterium]
MTSPRRRRPAPSRHGLLFGSDALYQVLAELAKDRGDQFTTKGLSGKIERTPEHTRSEIQKLMRLKVVEEVGRDRKARIYAVTDTPLADDLLELPSVLVAQLGRFKRPRALPGE